MNKKTREEIAALKETISNAVADLFTLAETKREKFYDMPESLQNDPIHQEMMGDAESIIEACDRIEFAMDDLE